MRVGLDVGSTTIKCVVLNENDDIVYSSYERHFSKIVEKTVELLEKLKNDVEEIFNMYTNEDEIDESPFPFLINLSKQAMVHPFVKRSNYIDKRTANDSIWQARGIKNCIMVL